MVPGLSGCRSGFFGTTRADDSRISVAACAKPPAAKHDSESDAANPESDDAHGDGH